MIKLFRLCMSTVVLTIVFLSVAGLAYADTNRIGIVTTNILNLRQHPDTTSKVLKKLYKDKQVSVIDIKDGWYKINFEDSIGWVSSKFVSLKAPTVPTAVINASNVNLRSLAGTSSDIKGKLKKGTKVSVLQTKSEWLKVKTEDGKIGWVSKSLIKTESSTVSRGNSDSEVSNRKQLSAQKVPEKIQVKNNTNNTANNTKNNTEDTTLNNTEYKNSYIDSPNNDTSPSSSNSDKDAKTRIISTDEIISFAMTLKGVPYVYGGMSTEGFDCSGFVSYVYKEFDIKLERVAADQAGQGTEVSKDSLKPGDLVFFDTNRKHSEINHVGIYIGDGKFIHASSGKSTHNVTVSDINNGFYAETFITSRRILD